MREAPEHIVGTFDFFGDTNAVRFGTFDFFEEV
jgi:hypothetical protein